MCVFACVLCVCTLCIMGTRKGCKSPMAGLKRHLQATMEMLSVDTGPLGEQP